jgi:predicted amidophosphoribosyltransferase
MRKGSVWLPCEGVHVLVVDDVVSTGASFAEVVRVLGAHGYEHITCYAFASGGL